MHYRTLGRTGIDVSGLGFGCMRLPTSGAPDKIDDALRFADIAREGFLARDAFQRAAAAGESVGDFLDVFNAGIIRSAEPECVNGRIRDHLGD